MIAKAKQKTPDAVSPWHDGFVTMLPTIRRHASLAFRALNPEAREEAIQEAICNTLVAYRRLVKLGKADLAYASVLARYAVAQVRSGRQIAERLNGNDVLSVYAQRKHRIQVDRLQRYDQRRGTWEDILVEDRRATPAQVAASRIDVTDWLASLTDRQREIASVLATGETTKAAAERFQLTPGRISQIRRELAASWRRFHDRDDT